ncbi:MAG TPA: MBL fold metallo-hydrolase [Stellaceae bacterium]|nr:MBL fold metallo-hydrolase [Stellaceae bacterium]
MRPVGRSGAGFFLLLILVLWRAVPTLAAGCSPPVAAVPRLAPAAFQPAAVAPGTADLTFLGHASFLLQSPGGVSIVTDYNGYIKPDFIPDIVTMNHAHPTHYTDFPDPGIKLVLRGWNTGGGIPHYNVSFGDVHIRNVSTNIRDYDDGTEFGGNSIFVFDIGGLCIAHLSHPHHTLTPQHLAELGEIDVLIAPVDGVYTLGLGDMLTVIDQIKAPLTIPMHYFTPRVLDRFLAASAGRYPVMRVEDHRVTLSRGMLPKVPTILVVPPITDG